MTARAHDCEEILQPTFRPRGDADSLEFIRLKNDLMYSVFNKCLLRDMGKTIVRKHLDNMNAQRVLEELATHMTTSSKGKAEKHRLHTYVTVLDKSRKGTTEEFILHFNEEFRQLDEVSPPEESLPYTTRLTFLQTAVHSIPELRMVETMEDFISLSSSIPGPIMGYDNYLTLLQNACIRYDSNLKSRPSPASRGAYHMTYLMTSMTTHIPRTPPPQVPPMVALTCQQRSSTRSILPTSIGLLMSPPLPLGSLPLPLPLADPPPEGLLDPSFFLPTSTNF